MNLSIYNSLEIANQLFALPTVFDTQESIIYDNNR